MRSWRSQIADEVRACSLMKPRRMTCRFCGKLKTSVCGDEQSARELGCEGYVPDEGLDLARSDE